MFKNLVGITAVVLIAVATVAAHSQIPTTTRAQRGESFVPKPSFAKATSLGFDTLLADFYWLWAVQIVGAENVAPDQHAAQLGRLIDVVTTLDPWVDHPYRFAAVWLTDSEQSVREANRLLERGIEYHPTDWRNYFYLGFNHFFYLRENAIAAVWLEKALEHPGTPAYLPRLVAKLRSDSADIYAAAVFLEQMIQDAPDDAARAGYQASLDEIEVEHHARGLDRARDAHLKLVGRDISGVEDLISGVHPLLAQLPNPEPSSLPASLRRASVWQHDESGRIISSYYGRRYELSLQPMDVERAEEWQRQREATAAGTGTEDAGENDGA